MPRVVFQLLWDEIMAGRKIVAYVKNRAKDGQYYWLMALVTPIEGGYLLVRFKPTSELLDVIQNLYRELRAVELRAEDAHRGKPAAIAASGMVLDAKLRSLGFAAFRSFMYEAFEREIRTREAALKRGAGRLRMGEGHRRSLKKSGASSSGTVDGALASLVTVEGKIHALLARWNAL